MLDNHEIDLALTTSRIPQHPKTALRTVPILWHSAPDFQLRPNEPIPLVVMDETNPYRKLCTHALDEAGLPWHVAYEAASSLPAVRAAVNAEVGVTARPMEMQNADLRILSEADGLPRLPDINTGYTKMRMSKKILCLPSLARLKTKNPLCSSPCG